MCAFVSSNPVRRLRRQLPSWPQIERRVAKRHVAIFRPALITAGDFQGICLVRNISTTGMMGHVHIQLPTETPVTIKTHFDYCLAGRVAWSNSVQVGVEFDEPIDVDHTLWLMSQRNLDGFIQRAPRLEVSCQANLQRVDETCRVELLDISQNGAKISGQPLIPGEIVHIIIDGLDSRRANVQWSREGRSGLTFFRTFRFEELAEWAITTHLKASEDK
ncbi:PilZ domain-containing protein [Aquisediminimonas sediminicola]|uniref:PilZ domain-containing protein n=1 Tax=Alteraquisediminimonas sediminicola TaxID=2676787 RepID=UPI001C8E42D5|nr:PilZ domain-containing protein [Aquisediminimonas sediminicola]